MFSSAEKQIKNFWRDEIDRCLKLEVLGLLNRLLRMFSSFMFYEKNVWKSDRRWKLGKTWNIKMILGTCWTTFLYMSMLKSHSVTLTLSQSLYLTLPHSLTLDLLNNQSVTLSLSHSISLDMLNNFCFHVYAQKSLFIGENDNEYFWPAPPSPVTLEVIELVSS